MRPPTDAAPAALGSRWRTASAGRLAVALTTLVALMVAGLLATLAPSAVALTRAQAQNGVGVIAGPATAVVGPTSVVLPGQRRARAPNYDQTAVGSSVAAEDAASLSGRVRINPELGDTAIRNAGRVPGEEGVFDVIGHGTPNELGGMSSSEVAGEIRGTPSWGGQDVRLLSCSTGCPTGSFAQDLANELGVGVRAPTTDIYVSSRGGITFDPGGEWRWFYPASAAP